MHYYDQPATGWDKMPQRQAAREATACSPKCPLFTRQCTTPEELASEEVLEIKAYKLGKKRWSYNQCELVLQEQGGSKVLTVKEAASVTQTSSDSSKDNCVVYSVTLNNGHKLRAEVYVVYDEPVEQRTAGRNTSVYSWTSVTRAACKRGCSGPVLRTIQRFGRLGRRSGGPAATASAKGKDNKERLKDQRYLYLSIDEAGTHVGVRRFRLLVGVYDADGQVLLGTGISAAIRVLANNDVPSGAAYIVLEVPISADWEGWGAGSDRAGRSVTLSMRGMKGSNNGSPVTPVSNTRTRSNSSSETSLSHRAHALIDSPDAAGSGRSATFRHMGPLGMVMQDQGFHMPLGASMLHHAYSSPDQLHGNLLGDLPHVHMGMVGIGADGSPTPPASLKQRSRSDPLASPDMAGSKKESASPSPNLAKQFIGTPMYPAHFPQSRPFSGLDEGETFQGHDGEPAMILHDIPSWSDAHGQPSALAGHGLGGSTQHYVQLTVPASALDSSISLQNLFGAGSTWLRHSQPVLLQHQQLQDVAMSQPKMEGGELVHFMSAGTTALQQQPPSLHFMPAPATAIHVTNPLSPSDGSLMGMQQLSRAQESQHAFEGEPDLLLPADEQNQQRF